MEFVKKIYKIIYVNRKFVLATADLVVVILSYYLSQFILSRSNVINKEILLPLIGTVLVASIIYCLLFWTFRIYSSITRYENGKDYLTYIFIALIVISIYSILEFVLSAVMTNLRLHILSAIIISMSMISYRLVIRMILAKKDIIMKQTPYDKTKTKNLLIIGAGSSARNIINTVRNHMSEEYNIIGMIDDNHNKIGYNISGIKVLGSRDKILEICQKNKVDIIYFTISKIAAKDKQEILNLCQASNAKLRILPSTEECIKSNKSLMDNLKDVGIEDILCRDPIVLDNKNIFSFIENNVVLVTGGGGSIGSELCRQIMTYKPKKLVILDVYENNLYDIEIELKAKYDSQKIEAVIASVRDEKALEQIFKKYNPFLVFHAAAHKHVPLMENSPLEAIKNNVFGTYNVVNMCDKYNVSKCILISSDKAVNPTNIMGATKRLCEMIIQAKNKVSKTEFVAVRFGNVLGSNGSVIPLFKKQIAAGGPITLTHKEITRYFMTIPEAVQLILQAITYANGGEIFVLDMGQPVKIYDLAVDLIKLSGLQPDVDISIEIIGLRPGEKLYEELLMKEEGLAQTNHEKIFTARPMDISMDIIAEKLEELNGLLSKDNSTELEIKNVIQKVVPTYIAKQSE